MSSSAPNISNSMPARISAMAVLVCSGRLSTRDSNACRTAIMMSVNPKRGITSINNSTMPMTSPMKLNGVDDEDVFILDPLSSADVRLSQ